MMSKYVIPRYQAPHSVEQPKEQYPQQQQQQQQQLQPRQSRGPYNVVRDGKLCNQMIIHCDYIMLLA